MSGIIDVHQTLVFEAGPFLVLRAHTFAHFFAYYFLFPSYCQKPMRTIYYHLSGAIPTVPQQSNGKAGEYYNSELWMTPDPQPLAVAGKLKIYSSESHTLGALHSLDQSNERASALSVKAITPSAITITRCCHAHNHIQFQLHTIPIHTAVLNAMKFTLLSPLFCRNLRRHRRIRLHFPSWCSSRRARCAPPPLHLHHGIK